MTQYTAITNLYIGDELYKFVNIDGMVCAINSKYIKNGVITKTLNGAEMCASRNLKDCIFQVKMRHDADELVEQGYSREVATFIACGHTREEAFEMEARLVEIRKELNKRLGA